MVALKFREVGYEYINVCVKAAAVSTAHFHFL